VSEVTPLIVVGVVVVPVAPAGRRKATVPSGHVVSPVVVVVVPVVAAHTKASMAVVVVVPVA